MKTVILTIATGNYIQFLHQFYRSLEKYCKLDFDLFCFTDYKGKILIPEADNIKIVYQKHKPFPYPTLYRYHIFTKNKELLKDYDFYWYNDIDMTWVGDVGNEIMSDLTATLHPGFANKTKEQFSYERNLRSCCYIPEGKGESYFCGGSNGGYDYLKIAEKLVEMIESDLDKGIMPVWHDETAINAFLYHNPPSIVLDPSYCFPGNERQVKEWGLSNLTPKIVALDKDHEKARGESCLL